MKRRIAMVLGGVVVVGLLLAGAWQVAYAQGQAAGREAVMNARADFLQTRAGASADAGTATGTPAGKPGGQGAAGKPGGQGGGDAGAGTATTKPGGPAGGTGGPGQGGGSRQAPVSGTIEVVQGTTLTLTTDSGPLAVTLGDQTQIRKQVAATPSDLKPGERIVVGGTRAADGTLTAATIQIQGQ